MQQLLYSREYSHRTRLCMCRAKRDQAEIWRRVDHDGKESTCWRQIYRCSDVWTCPVCSAPIMQQRNKDIAQGVQAWGLPVLVGTLTLPHSRDDEARTLVGYLQDCSTKMRQNKTWANQIAPRFGVWVEPGDTLASSNRKRGGYVLPTVVTKEDTWGVEHGHHPHAHIAFFPGVYMTEADRAEFERLLSIAWAAAVRSVCGREPSAEHGCKVTLPPAAKAAATVAAYLTKGAWGVGSELEGSHSKAAKEGRYNPRQLLEQYADALERGDTGAQKYWGDVFDEYRRAFKGRAQTSWSPGLKKYLGIDQVEDEEAVEKADDAVEEEIVAALGPHAYAQVRKEKAEILLLSIAKHEGFDGVARWLAARGLDCGVSEAPWLEYMSPDMVEARAGP